MKAPATSLREARRLLLEHPELKGDAFCREHAAAADRWLGSLLEEATGGNLHGIALLAVGGYGRGELCPHSDLDVVLLHDSRRGVADVAERVWYPVWDEGVRLDHSVRRPDEVLEVARHDLRAQLGLLDGRVVAGDRELGTRVVAQALAQWRDGASRWLPALAEQVGERKRDHGDVAFLLEPDLKESHGGLRDLHALRALVMAVRDLEGVSDMPSLSRHASVLTAARVELQRHTSMPTDRLVLQEQDRVATALGYADADALMAEIAAAGRAIAWNADDAWRRRYLWEPARYPRRPLALGKLRAKLAQPGPESPRSPESPESPGKTSRRASSEAVEAEAGISVQRYAGHAGRRGVKPGGMPGAGEVVLVDRSLAAADPSTAMRVAAVAAERSLPIERDTLDLLARDCPPPPEPWSAPLRSAFVRVLAAGPPAIEALEALDQRGLLTRILPEWEAVRNRPQRNAYHRFTVDRHLLETAAGAALIAHRVDRPDLLLVGSLLHDIGKGFPGDHTERGVEIVSRIAARMGFEPEDASVLVEMVRNHLLLPDAATRRDLEDPATISAVVRAAGSRTVLDLLSALAEADGLATGPSAWGPWKAGLVADLVRRAASAFDGKPASADGPDVIEDSHRPLIASVRSDSRTRLLGEGSRVSVVSPDRPGLLAAVAGVFALWGLDVRSANASGEGGVAVEVFVVEPSRGRWPEWSRVEQDIDAALHGRLDLERRLAERAHTYRRARRTASPRPAPVSVTIDNAASSHSTVIEVRAEDEAGLLHRVAKAMAAIDLDIVSARVATLGHEVVDAFYVREAGGAKLAEHSRIKEVEAALRRAAIAPSSPGGD